MQPTAQSRNEVRRLDCSSSVLVKHGEQLPEVRLVNVHDSQPVSKLRHLSGAVQQLLKVHCPTAVLIDSLENLLQELEVALSALVHFLRHGDEILLSCLCKFIDHNCNNQVQDSEKDSEKGSDEDHGRPGMVQDHWRHRIIPSITSNDHIKEQEVGCHDGVKVPGTKVAALQCRACIQAEHVGPHQLHSHEGPEGHHHKTENKGPEQRPAAAHHHSHKLAHLPQKAEALEDRQYPCDSEHSDNAKRLEQLRIREGRSRQ
mmetsp:Transcript_68691/g.163619  ORF Transcript_68691/g.163619 Transcript_68691/m.163619 type:complete len:259 (-) Transcript_68691:563-1339(-)